MFQAPVQIWPIHHLSALHCLIRLTETAGNQDSILMVFLSQFFINIGMNLGLMPVTGIPLPFMSYGGTSLVVSMAMLGILQSVWVHRKSDK